MRGTLRARAAAAFLVASMLGSGLAGCGGSDGSAVPIDAGLPAALTVSAPGAPQALGSNVAFGSNAVDPQQLLSYHWDFGDGTTSALATPTHAYAKAGLFTVRLTVGTEGGSVSGTATVAVADFAIVAGKDCSGGGSSGWCWQRPLPQGNYIADYVFVDDTHGWAVGEGGTILVTADGGVSWNPQASGTQLDLGQARFVSAQVGWVASSAGELLRTADGGASWQRVSYGRNDDIQTLGATDANTAWVTTLFGSAFLTRDGGRQWDAIPPPPGGAFRFTLVSGTDIWALPPFIDGQPSLWHSLDGGTVWTPVALPAIEPGLAGYSFDLQFGDADHALVAGFESGFADADPGTFVARPTLRITADRGASWQTVAPPADVPGFSNYSLGDGTTVFSFVTGTALQRTADNGATWLPVPMPATTSSFIGFKALDGRRLLLMDATGVVSLSVDAGAHWASRGARGSEAPQLNSVWFFDSREGLALADDGSSVRTSDGGQSWIASPGSGIAARRAQFLADGSVGWVISDAGTVQRSVDKGRTWQTPASPPSAPIFGATDLHFVDALHGWAVTPFGGGDGAIFGTVDGGSSWQAFASTKNVSGMVSVRFADLMHGMAVGPAGIAMVSADGGATWAPRSTGVASNLRRLALVDASTAVGVGEAGAIVRSTDRGQSWNPVPSPTARTLNDVRFVSARVGHAVGEGGVQLATRDGGLSWSVVPTRVQTSLQAVFFLDEQTGWAVGRNGSILATATGGL